MLLRIVILFFVNFAVVPAHAYTDSESRSLIDLAKDSKKIVVGIFRGNKHGFRTNGKKEKRFTKMVFSDVAIYKKKGKMSFKNKFQLKVPDGLTMVSDESPLQDTVVLDVLDSEDEEAGVGIEKGKKTKDYIYDITETELLESLDNNDINYRIGFTGGHARFQLNNKYILFIPKDKKAHVPTTGATNGVFHVDLEDGVHTYEGMPIGAIMNDFVVHIPLEVSATNTNELEYESTGGDTEIVYYSENELRIVPSTRPLSVDEFMAEISEFIDQPK